MLVPDPSLSPAPVLQARLSGLEGNTWCWPLTLPCALPLFCRLVSRGQALEFTNSCCFFVTLLCALNLFCRLVCRGQVLESSTSGARAAMRRALQRQGVTVLEGDAAMSVQQGSVTLASGRKLQCDECIWATGVGGRFTVHH